MTYQFAGLSAKHERVVLFYDIFVFLYRFHVFHFRKVTENWQLPVLSSLPHISLKRLLDV